MRSIFCKPILGLCLLLGAAHAGAADNPAAQAGIRTVSWTVTDLTPGDGQSAGMQVLSVSARQEAIYVSPDGEYHLQRSVQDRIANATVSMDVGDSHARAWFGDIAGDMRGESSTVATAETGTRALTRAGLYMLFALLPHTSLTIDGNMFGQVVATPPEGLAYLSTEFTLYRPHSGDSDWLAYYGDELSTRGDRSSFSDDFSFTYNNNSDSMIELELNAGVRTAAELAPVPEPASYATLGGGLLLLGALSKRRGRTSAS
jgi:hypothetical protein